MRIAKHISVGVVLLAATLGSYGIARSAPPITKDRIIQSAVTISSPSNNANVRSPLTIKGTATPRQPVEVAVKSIFDGRASRAQNITAVPNRNGEWTTRPLTLDVPNNVKKAQFEITASQKIGSRTQKSKAVKVNLMRTAILAPRPGNIQGPISSQPPVATLDPAPIITSPANNSRVNSPLTVQGTGERNGRVTITIKSTFTGGGETLGTYNLPTDSRGKWQTSRVDLWLPEGARNARFEISAMQTVGQRAYQSKISVLPPTNIRYVSDLAISSPANNSTVSSPLMIRGTAAKNGQVTVDVRAVFTNGSMSLNKYTVNPNNSGSWQTPSTELWLPYGAKNARFEIIASQGSGSNMRQSRVAVSPSSSINYVLAKPTITSPTRDAQMTLPRTVRIQGTGIPGHRVEVTVRGYWGSAYGNGNRQAGQGSAIVNSSGQWSASVAVESVVPGGDVYRESYYQISAKQAFPDNKFSAAATSTFHSQRY